MAGAWCLYVGIFWAWWGGWIIWSQHWQWGNMQSEGYAVAHMQPVYSHFRYIGWCERQQIPTIVCQLGKRPLCQAIWHSLWALYKHQLITYSQTTAMVYNRKSLNLTPQAAIHKEWYIYLDNTSQIRFHNLYIQYNIYFMQYILFW
jgi:hypothetical protein